MGRVPHSLSPIFHDRVDYPASGDLDVLTRQALEQSAALILLASPAAAATTAIRAARATGTARIFAENAEVREDAEKGFAREAGWPSAISVDAAASAKTRAARECGAGWAMPRHRSSRQPQAVRR